MFKNYISVYPVYGASEIILGQTGLNKKYKDITKYIS